MRRHVAFVPKAAVSNRSKVAVLFDHLVSSHKQLVGHGEAERVGSLEVDHQLEFARPDHWEVGWLFTLENATCVDAGLAKTVRKVRSQSIASDSGIHAASGICHVANFSKAPPS